MERSRGAGRECEESREDEGEGRAELGGKIVG